MKKILTTAALVAMVVTSATAHAGTAKTVAKDNKNYVSASGSLAKSGFQVKDNGRNFNHKSDKDFGGEIAYGHYFTENVRAELAGGYSKIKISDLNLHRKTLALMANTYYDFKNTSLFTPYVMGGIGTASNHHESLFKKSTNTSFVWQVGTGVDAKVADNVKLGIGYRYRYNTDNVKFINASTHSNLDAKYKPEHLAIATVKFEF